ncbi:GPI ethanolamine phosphate transferase 2 [Lingula anatina]|uniref:GPI ethanolamine phosphate transferase 2 n=1 Tax=Lingula anatina TaxID=7574 RepID=A0A1S3J408_LINAN|nr:GPI ethanolamine phosphate transferase 2 [Lingula anatina]|eukprot:XP_013405157.1 GPI ethanolamine phosphate transferase 2 [Lingula anatina]
MKIKRSVFILGCVCLEVLGFLVFLKGFFPVKSAISGHASFIDLPPQPIQDKFTQAETPSLPVPPLFGRMVIVLIDALRADFVFNTTKDRGMPYVKDQITKQEAVSFVAKAHPPTVTMPRIKAMTTGGIPGFIDVVLNFDSKSLTEDNFITQLHRNGKKIVFYGDDTWIRLFPEHFLREDGTTSFFVTDYTEVDDNVTRHLPDELERTDWDVMILHYLGLDHIGHLAGPHSPLMGPKLKEMDGIMEKIHKAVIKQDSDLELPTLVVLCGDHGMSDQGSHGGSSVTEVSTPLVLLSSLYSNKKGVQFDWSTLQQIDLAPILSTLMGVPIPQNSLGALPTDVLWKYDLRLALRAMQLNAHQVALVYKQNVANYEKKFVFIQYEQAIKKHESWLHKYYNKEVALDEQSAYYVMKAYRDSVVAMRDQVARSLASYDLYAMIIAISLLCMVPMGIVAALFSPDGSSVQVPSCGTVRWLCVASGVVAVAGHFTVCTTSYKSELLCPGTSGIPAVILVVVTGGIVFTMGASGILLLTAFLAVVKSLLVQMTRLPIVTKCFLLGNVLHTISLLSSSFVEEEHQTWYFFTMTVHMAVTGLAIWSYKDQLEDENKISDAVSTTLKDAFNTDQTNCRKPDQKHAEQSGNCFRTVVHPSSELHEVSPSNELHRNTSSVSNENTGNSRRKASSRVNLWTVFGMLIVLMLCRLLRSWNQTGIKWADQTDIGDWLVSPENKLALSVIVVVSLAVITFLLMSLTDDQFLKIMVFIAAVGIFTFKAANGGLVLPGIYSEVTKGVLEARVVYAVVALSLLYTAHKTVRNLKLQPYNTQTFLQLTKSLLVLWTLTITLLMRPHNIPLVAQILLQQVLISRCVVDIVEAFSEDSSVIFLYIWMGNAAFFYQGNSNSITTVDVSAGYVGLDGYSPVLIGTLMCAATYAGPVFWFLALLVKLTERRVLRGKVGKQLKESFLQLACLLILSQSIPNAVYTVLVTLQRYHLFVWSVFSPKLLYQGMTLLVTFLQVVFILMASFMLEKVLLITN